MDAPTVAVSDDGKKFAVGWMGNPREKDRDVLWAVSAAGEQLPQETLASESADGVQGHPIAGADRSGVFHLAWEDARGIWYRTSEAASKPERLTAEGAWPSLSAGKSVGVAWEQGGNAEFKKLR